MIHAFLNHISQPFNAELRNLHHQTLVLMGWVEQNFPYTFALGLQRSRHVLVSPILMPYCKHLPELDKIFHGLQPALDALEQTATAILIRRHPYGRDLQLVLTCLRIGAAIQVMGYELRRWCGLPVLDESESPTSWLHAVEVFGQQVIVLFTRITQHFARLESGAAAVMIQQDWPVLQAEAQLLNQPVPLNDPIKNAQQAWNRCLLIQGLVLLGEQCAQILRYIQALADYQYHD